MDALSIADLYKRAKELAGRDVVVDQLNNGQYIVMWMRFGESPPPAAESEAGALEKFIIMLENKKAQDALLPELSSEDLKDFGDIESI